MKKVVFIAIISISLILVLSNFCGVKYVRADQLSDEIDKQIDNIDVSELENFFNSISEIPENVKFSDVFYGALKGEYEIDFNGVKDYIVKMFLLNVKRFLPNLISIVAISIFCLIMQSGKNNFSSDSTSQTVFWVCVLSVFALLIGEIIYLYNVTKNTINLLMKLIEIMSPIMMTLTVASGGNISASIYSPTMTFLSGTIAEVFSSTILPLTCTIAILSFIGSFSKTVKLGKIIEFINSLIKWIVGITLTVFAVFVTVQGITAGSHDGIALRVTKYALSNSIPLIGGFISSGMEVVLAGSLIIKNTVGLTGVFVIFYLILSPIIKILAFTLSLKFISGIIEIYSDTKIPDLCSITSKCVTNFIVVILGVGFAFLISILLTIFSVGAFL